MVTPHFSRNLLEILLIFPPSSNIKVKEGGQRRNICYILLTWWCDVVVGKAE